MCVICRRGGSTFSRKKKGKEIWRRARDHGGCWHTTTPLQHLKRFQRLRFSGNYSDSCRSTYFSIVYERTRSIKKCRWTSRSLDEPREDREKLILSLKVKFSIKVSRLLIILKKKKKDRYRSSGEQRSKGRKKFSKLHFTMRNLDFPDAELIIADKELVRGGSSRARQTN